MKNLDEENYCEGCEFSDECDVAGETEFCENCKDYNGCSCKAVCMAGRDIECNNGFVSRWDDIEIWDEEDEPYMVFIMTDDGLVPFNDDEEDGLPCQDYVEGSEDSVDYCEHCDFRAECNMVDRVAFCEYCENYLNCSSQDFCLAGYEIGGKKVE